MHNSENAAPEDKNQKIFLLRHARPELPHGGRLYYGHTDYPLSQSGAERAKLLRGELRGVKFSRIYSSDLERARHTAKLAVPDENTDIIFTPELREIFLGEWEGKSFDEVRSVWDELYEKRGSDFAKVPPPGGESFTDLQKRAVPAFVKILNESPSGNILIVTHAAFIWSVMCHYFAFDLKDLFFYPLDFCGLHLLQNTQGHMRMIRYNWNPQLMDCKFL